MAFICALLLVSVRSAFASHSEIISDILSPVEDEGRALDIKSQQFWELIKHAAQETHIDEHIAVYAEVEAALAAMPAENDHVHGLMTEALMRLKRADEKVLSQALQSSELASEKLATGPESESMLSFMRGGQNFLAHAVRRFIGGTDYVDRVSAQVNGRQGDVLPTLRGAAAITGNVLDDSRMASKLSFDVLKYDIYNKGVPKTPAAAKAAANKIVDAAGQTRHHFMQGIIGIAHALTKDTEEKYINPSAKVTQTLLTDLQPFGKKVMDDDIMASTTGDTHEQALFIDLQPFASKVADDSKSMANTQEETIIIDL